MSQEPPNSPQPKNKRKSRSRRGSEGTSPKKSSPPPFWQNIVSNLSRGISGLFETGALRLPTLPWIGIIGLIVAIAIWAISNFFSAKSNPVANVTPTPETPLPNIEQEVEVKPTPIPEATPPSQIIPTQSIEDEETALPEPETQITSTQSIEDEETPLPEPEATPTPTPPKKIVLTPEQALIAAIENKVVEISDRIASGLIQSIEANFRTSSLTVIIVDQWYDLTVSEQRKLATQMLQRSQELDFSHLEIIDVQKRLVARNPVVGAEIILFNPVSKS